MCGFFKNLAKASDQVGLLTKVAGGRYGLAPHLYPDKPAQLDPAIKAEQDATIAANAQMAVTRRKRQISSLLAGGSTVLGAPAGGAASGGGTPAAAAAPSSALASRAIRNYSGYSGAGLA